jgi:predicted alpha-1,6-mannanase (GH76 family)
METAANFLALAGASSPEGARARALVEATFAALQPQVCDCWRDDQLWVTLAWARAARVTGNATYLAAAQAVFADLVGPWAAWNSSCGGVNWEKGVPYRNSITNQLFLTAAMRLHEAAGGSAPPVAGRTYLEWARKEWAWLNATALYDARRALACNLFFGVDAG